MKVLSIIFFLSSMFFHGESVMHPEDNFMLLQMYFSFTNVGSIPWVIGSDLCDPLNAGFVLNTDIPTIICDDATPQRVTKIQISSMGIYGGIASEIGSLLALNTLIMNDNHLSGEIPLSINSLTSLSVLELQNNQLSGSISLNLEALSSLTTLNLGGSNLFCPSFDFQNVTNNDYSQTSFCGPTYDNGNSLNVPESESGGNDPVPTVDMSFCDSNPCQNGGGCIAFWKICDCTGTGFTGAFCETRVFCFVEQSNNAEFASVPSFTQVYGTCNLGYVGMPLKICQADGTFTDLISGQCVKQLCTPQSNYVNADWPLTWMGATAVGTCVSGYSGTPTRKCLADGVWSTALATYCQRNQCPAVSENNANWAATNSLLTAAGTCKTGYFGSVIRTCQADGTWGDITGSCQPTTTPCPSETYGKAVWPLTLAGQTAQGTCTAGFTGTPTRICTSNGTWQTLINNTCNRIQCSSSSLTVNGVTVSYPTSLSNTNVAGVCANGSTAKVYRFCDVNGVWASTASGTCK